eukprot:2749756-Alexandrium_andersonii.AAC.1
MATAVSALWWWWWWTSPNIWQACRRDPCCLIQLRYMLAMRTLTSREAAVPLHNAGPAVVLKRTQLQALEDARAAAARHVLDDT